MRFTRLRRHRPTGPGPYARLRLTRYSGSLVAVAFFGTAVLAAGSTPNEAPPATPEPRGLARAAASVSTASPAPSWSSVGASWDVREDDLQRGTATDRQAQATPAGASVGAEATPAATVAPAESTVEPTVEPTAPPTPSPATAAAGSSSRCSTPMPAGPPDGWSRALTSPFSEVTPLGSWPGPIASESWRNRQAGYTDSSGRGTYDSSKTVSEGNGILDIWIHSAVDGAPHVHDPAGARYVAAPIPTMGHTLGARISICMRADVVPGYKIAFLLWPDEGPGNYHGEIDFPEGRLLEGATPTAFMHYAPKPADGKNQDAYESGVSLQDWHVYTTEWDPTASPPYVKFYRDGTLIGHSTEHVPTRPMQYVVQVETYLPGQELPAPAEGHVQVDWVTIDLP